MKNLTLCVIAVLFLALPAAGQWKQPHAAAAASSAMLVQDQPAAASSGSPWTERKTTAIILSTLIPGAGQSYLGNGAKGAAFTLGAFGSGLITLLAQNNVVGRNERINELVGQYKLSVKFDSADAVWQKMQETKSILDKDVKRRNIFRALTAVIWVANLVDVVLFTEDRGEKSFGSIQLRENATVAVVPDSRNGLNALVEIQF